METIKLHHKTGILKGTVTLPASKSESNRALIIRALCGDFFPIHNLSDANDTQLLQQILADNSETINTEDAGTVMRFLAAYFAVTGQYKTLTGTERMCQRPIGILADALRKLGAKIDYVGETGFPPLKFSGFEPDLSIEKIEVPGNISSQFISALLLVAPTLPKGLQLEITGDITSRPYIEMTLAQMQHFGVSATWSGNVIEVPAQKYQPKPFTVEADWSAASYWYSMAALAKEAEIFLPNLKQNSLQGDSIIALLMENFGVKTIYSEEGVLLLKQPNELSEMPEIDFKPFPDLAQTIIILSAALGVKLKATGLQTLRIKETDRIAALQNELTKTGAELSVIKPGIFELTVKKTPQNQPIFKTYHDHRMAMSLAPLALLNPIEIEDPEVVRKSYPGFWDELRKIGFEVTV